MFYSNAHTHSTWCDGKDTLADMAQAAIDLGFTDLGFTCHSPAPFDPSCPGVQNEAAYQAALRELKQQLAGQLNIVSGLEWDYYSPDPMDGYDYTVGSVHYFPPRQGIFRSVDESPASLMQTLDQWYQGDSMQLVQDYYDTVVKHINQNHAKIVGHFDLITKFNEKHPWLDEDSEKYQAIALKALNDVIDIIQTYDGMVEINTGAISRNWRTTPYPNPFLLKQLKQRECPIIITSDSHETVTLTCHFSETVELLKTIGFTATRQLKDGIFQPISFD
ncbi:histidinol-phosphatase [Enterococcus xiangfangensis]|uniref:Histidinol-phosphatase n=1 Tax=Enterococcus xiangfangensis TaxID=1296537 RepID=A0ABU3FAL3_9ENTE|nr:histidinol-phosphatase [Enterococcus xiangfangensis]MDT2759718.1 histidinol-phosphatase [Enterococcus xiangfangensis]